MINVLISLGRKRPQIVQVPTGTADIKLHLENRFPGESVVIMRVYGEHTKPGQKTP